MKSLPPWHTGARTFWRPMDNWGSSVHGPVLVQLTHPREMVSWDPSEGPWHWDFTIHLREAHLFSLNARINLAMAKAEGTLSQLWRSAKPIFSLFKWSRSCCYVSGFFSEDAEAKQLAWGYHGKRKGWSALLPFTFQALCCTCPHITHQVKLCRLSSF